MDGQKHKRTVQPDLAFWGIYEAFLYSWKPSSQYKHTVTVIAITTYLRFI